MLFQVGGQCFLARRVLTELAFERDVTSAPAVCRERGAVEKEDAFAAHQVFILVMMS